MMEQKVFKKSNILLLSLIIFGFQACFSYADTPQQTKAREYALTTVYERLGEKRELSESELAVVEQIEQIYQSTQEEMTKKSAEQNQKTDPEKTTTNASFDVLAKRFFAMRGELYEFFLSKNFGTTDDVQTQPKEADDEAKVSE